MMSAKDTVRSVKVISLMGAPAVLNHSNSSSLPRWSHAQEPKSRKLHDFLNLLGLVLLHTRVGSWR